MNPNQTTGVNFNISAVGTLGAKPRTRRLNADVAPTRNAIPMVWSVRMPGNANIDGDSRIQILNRILSNAIKKASTLYLSFRPCVLLFSASARPYQ